MRNLAEYPITTAEIVQCLRDMSDELLKEQSGDMRPLLLKAAAERLDDHIKLGQVLGLLLKKLHDEGAKQRRDLAILQMWHTLTYRAPHDDGH